MSSPPDVAGPSSIVLFNKAENVQLQDTHIAVTIGNNNTNQNIVINPKSKWDPIELLLHYCALDGLVDSKERYDPPKCAPETREAILRDIIAWSRGGVSTPMFLWLYGSAGAGKSAICQTVAEHFRREGTLLANFFFSRGAVASGRSNGDRLIPTLIYQLQLNLPETRSFIKKVIRKERSILTSTRATQMEGLFCAALNQFSVRRWFRDLSGKQSRLVVLDGWDECQDKEVQCDLLRIIADAAATMSMPLRFIIASRPEAHIKHTFNIHPSLNTGSVRRINLDEDQDARVAIFKFVRAKFRNILDTHPLRQHFDPSWPSDQIVELIVAKSSPQFIFASTAMSYISFANDRPDIRLNAIITMAESPPEDPDEAPLENIDRLYRFIFSGVHSKHRSNVWIILAIIHLASRKEFTVPTPSPLFFEGLFNVLPGTVDIMLIPLLSVISLPLTRDAPIKSLHASLFDFLLDRHRSGDMVIHLAPAHSRLLEYYGHLELKSVNPGLYKGILRHDTSLDRLELERRPHIDHITINALIALGYTYRELDPMSSDIAAPLPEMPNSSVTREAVELIELVFECLVKHGAPQGHKDDDSWLFKRLKYDECLLRLPEGMDNPFTTLILRARHCAYTLLIRGRSRNTHNFANAFLPEKIARGADSTKSFVPALHAIAATATLVKVDLGMQSADTYQCLVVLGEAVLGARRQIDMSEELATIACESLMTLSREISERPWMDSHDNALRQVQEVANKWASGARNT